MRTLATTILLIVIYTTQSVGQKDNGFTITIDESAHLTGYQKIITITPDSVKGTSRYYIMDKKADFRKALTYDERKKLNRALSKINLDSLRDSYINNRVDDGIDFEFILNFKNKTKRTTIHYIRHADILNLVGQINKMIPKDFELHYNEDYLKFD